MLRYILSVALALALALCAVAAIAGCSDDAAPPDAAHVDGAQADSGVDSVDSVNIDAKAESVATPEASVEASPGDAPPVDSSD